MKPRNGTSKRDFLKAGKERRGKVVFCDFTEAPFFAVTAFFVMWDDVMIVPSVWCGWCPVPVPYLLTTEASSKPENYHVRETVHRLSPYEVSMSKMTS